MCTLYSVQREHINAHSTKLGSSTKRLRIARTELLLTREWTKQQNGTNRRTILLMCQHQVIVIKITEYLVY